MKVKSIAILGIGGVGGFVGATILSTRKNDSIQLAFIARGETYQNLKSDGLVFSSPGKEEVLSPDRLIPSGQDVTPFDLVILATKSHSLKGAILENQSIFGKNTLVIPLQNMVNAARTIQPLVNGAEVLDACIYLISNVVRPGHVKHLGGPGKVIMEKPLTDKYTWAFTFLSQSGLPLELVKNASTHLWKKFLFISSLGTFTAANNITFGEIKKRNELKELWRNLMEELLQLAQSRNVSIDNKAIEEAMGLIYNFPDNAKSSFQLDIENGVFGEKGTLVDEVISDSLSRDLACPYYQAMERKITRRLQRMSHFND
jgi:2-dehydropantoate 2-reductase